MASPNKIEEEDARELIQALCHVGAALESLDEEIGGGILSIANTKEMDKYFEDELTRIKKSLPNV